MHEIASRRLVFVRLDTSDAEFMLGLMNEPGYLRYIGDRGVKSLTQAAEFVTDRLGYDEAGLGFYKLVLKATAESIGIAGVIKREFLQEPDVGYALLSRFEGHGYATEAAQTALAYAFDDLLMEKVGAILSKDNLASIRVLEKLGMKPHGEVTYPDDDERLLYYEMSKGDAPEQPVAS